MKVGKYQIGRYHAIIKKYYEDGEHTYETSFSDKNDLMLSVSAIAANVGKVTGRLTDNPQKLVKYEIYRGKEKIINELNTNG